MPATPKIILYHYPFSPYARKVFWYLRLRSIPFTQCLQPPILPRPDLSQQLGITYRRIPICAIDKDIYCDTSLILRELSLRFPYCTPQACGGKEILADVDELAVGGMHAKMITTLVENWGDEVFVLGLRLLPANLPLLNDEGFRKDRERFWAKGSINGTRDEALASMRRLFHTVETVFLAGDKKWILGGDKPTIADVMAIWSLDWVTTFPNALCPDPTDPSSKPLITPQSHPLTFSWISRFQSLLKSLPPAKESIPTISGPDAKLSILSSGYSSSGVVSVDELDPLGLKAGDDVEVVPTDSGVLDPQRGKLVGLEVTKVAVEVEVPEYGGKETVRVWFPRRNYKITKVGEKAKI